MSTRALIARQTGAGQYDAVYSHSDGYPGGLGRTLHAMCREHFAGDGRAMSAYLIDAHPEGWSGIGGDASQPSTWIEPSGRRALDPSDPGYAAEWRRNVSYKGRAGEGNQAGLLHAGDDMDQEWIYMLEAERMVVLQVVGGENTPVGSVRFDRDTGEVAWGALECGENLERCSHIAGHHFDDLPEESRCLSTAVFLGAVPLSIQNHARGFRVHGRELEVTGGYRDRDWDAEAGAWVYKPAWIAVLRGTWGREERKVYRTLRSGEVRCYKGVEPLFPPVAADLGLTIADARI